MPGDAASANAYGGSFDESITACRAGHVEHGAVELREQIAVALELGPEAVAAQLPDPHLRDPPHPVEPGVQIEHLGRDRVRRPAVGAVEHLDPERAGRERLPARAEMVLDDAALPDEAHLADRHQPPAAGEQELEQRRAAAARTRDVEHADRGSGIRFASRAQVAAGPRPTSPGGSPSGSPTRRTP